MMTNLKTLVAVMITPVILVTLFKSNQIKSEVNRSPAVVETHKEVKSVRSITYSAVLALNSNR